MNRAAMEAGWNRDNPETAKYFRMNRTILQMMKDRGYNVNAEELEMELDTFALQYSGPQQLNAEFHHPDPGMPFVRTRFDVGMQSGKFATPELKNLFEEAEASGCRRMVVVVKDGIVTAGTKKTIARIAAAQRLRIEVFEHREVVINITEHELVPKHEPLSQEEKEQLLAHYSAKDSQLPRIKVTDPVARYFGVEAGTVMKITRKSETAGRYIMYRLVV